MDKIESKYLGGNWYSGTYDDNYSFEAKVFQESSQYGIDDGQISKLSIYKDDDWCANYDRGWDIEVAEDDMEAYVNILNHLEDRPLAPYKSEIEDKYYQLKSFK